MTTAAEEPSVLKGKELRFFLGHHQLNFYDRRWRPPLIRRYWCVPPANSPPALPVDILHPTLPCPHLDAQDHRKSSASAPARLALVGAQPSVRNSIQLPG